MFPLTSFTATTASVRTPRDDATEASVPFKQSFLGAWVEQELGIAVVNTSC